MTKGYRGETCYQAIRSSLSPVEIVRYTEIFSRVRRKGSWKEATIRRHLMSCVTNLPPARQEWKSIKPFLFLRGDGRYEIYDPEKHPKVIE